MQVWSVSPQNGLKMCKFLRGITCATGCNRSPLRLVAISPSRSGCVVWKACNCNCQSSPNQSGPVQFSVFFWLHGPDLQTLWGAGAYPRTMENAGCTKSWDPKENIYNNSILKYQKEIQWLKKLPQCLHVMERHMHYSMIT